jgi:hypothetical protein
MDFDGDFLEKEIVAFNFTDFRGEEFLEIRNKVRLWWPCLLTDQIETSNLQRGPSVDASYYASSSFGQGVSEEKILYVWFLIKTIN